MKKSRLIILSCIMALSMITIFSIQDGESIVPTECPNGVHCGPSQESFGFVCSADICSEYTGGLVCVMCVDTSPQKK